MFQILFCGVLKLFLRGANHPRPPCGDGTALDIMQMTVLFVNHIPIVFILCEREWGYVQWGTGYVQWGTILQTRLCAGFGWRGGF